MVSNKNKNRKKLIGGFSFLSILMIFVCLGGILIYKETNYQMDSIVYFVSTGLITIISIIVTIYNIIKLIKENEIQYSPLQHSDLSNTNPYSST